MIRVWLLLILLLAKPVAAQELLADLSSHIISIKTDFKGESLVLFGTLDAGLLPTDNLVVTIFGPEQQVVVRRKELAGAVWVNVPNVRFEKVPSFYAVHTALPLTSAVADTVRQRQFIGVDTLPLPAAKVKYANVDDFRQALIRQKKQAGLFQESFGTISLLGRLFRLGVSFPVTVPTGQYMVNVYLIRNNDVISAQSIPLQISKDGIGAEIFYVAHKWPWLYALGAILTAVLAGWLAAVFFRKV